MKLAALVVVIAIVLTVLVVQLQRVDYEGFMKDSYQATAQVVTQREVVIDPKNQRKEAQVEYRYMANGRVYTGNEKIEYPDLWQKMTPGRTVDIYVSNKDAGESFLTEPMDRRLGKKNAK